MGVELFEMLASHLQGLEFRVQDLTGHRFLNLLCRSGLIKWIIQSVLI